MPLERGLSKARLSGFLMVSFKSLSTSPRVQALCWGAL